MLTPRFQRFLVLMALGIFSLLCVQSCVLDGFPGAGLLPCAAQSSSQKAFSACDIYDAAHTPCVAAFSTTRALYGSYAGPLYQVTRTSDMAPMSVGVLSDGYADAAAQDRFCANTGCIITKIFDQSPHHNDLTVAPGGTVSGKGPGGEDLPAFAHSLQIIAGGHKVYGLYLSAGMGYRDDATSGVAVNGEPQGVYMVSSDIHVDSQCCFDFGNAEKNNHNNGTAHMDALRLTCNNPCTPSVGLDMENGTYPYPPFTVRPGLPFVTAMGTNDGQHNYSVYWANAQAGCLTTSGPLSFPSNAYTPMHQEGAIILGIGGDNSNFSTGSFFEGAMTAGVPSNATLINIQANVVSVGYAAAPQP
jgi:hypothetical protein